jgi:hypothetical protein
VFELNGNNIFGAATVEQMTVLESIAEDTVVFLQIHKRVWPAAQRDSLFWSHIRKVPNSHDEDGQDFWIVCNKSTEHPDFPVSIVCIKTALLLSMVAVEPCWLVLHELMPGLYCKSNSNPKLCTVNLC